MKPKKKRNKKYVPKMRTHGQAFAGLVKIGEKQADAVPMDEERQLNVLIAYHTAIDAIVGGYAEPESVDTVIYALNVARILSDMGIGDGYNELIYNGMTAVTRLIERFEKTGKYGFDGEGLTAVKEFAELHEAQVQTATHGELTIAIKEMHRRMAAGHKFQPREAERIAA